MRCRAVCARGGKTSLFSLLLMGAAMMFSPPLQAQQDARITGTVTAQSGQPVSGAIVSIDDTNRNTMSNARGEFTLSAVPAREIEVRVTALGYRTTSRTVTVAAGQSITMDFTLAISAVALDEMVVTGQAAGVARREIGTSIASVDMSELEYAPVNSFSQVLAARAPGVNVMPGGGKSGQGSRIVLRGAASVTQSNEPLIYVDGVRMDNSSSSGIGTTTAGASWSGIDDINPDDIERIEIIRGASAATLYGTEASAGVIQIFTRRGREGAAQWRYNGSYGVLNTPRDWWAISEYSDWFYDDIVESGSTQSHQVSVSGGGSNFTYYGSMTGRTEDGILPNGGEDAYSARLNLALVPSDNLTLRFNSGFTRRSVQHTPDANNTRGITINGLVGGPSGQFIPTDQIRAIEAFQNGNRFTGGIAAEHQITSALSHRLTFGADIFNSDEHQLFPFGQISNLPAGFRSNYRRQNLNLNLDYTATLRAQLTEEIRSTTSAGTQYFNRDQGWSSAIGDGFPFVGLETVSAALSTSGAESRLKEKSAGFFLEQQLGFREFLFVTFGARADAHSAFGEEVDYQLYPKADISYVISEHGFLPSPIGTVRLRGSYGTAGQQPSNFSAVRTWASESAVGGQPAVRPGNIGNPNLKAEVSTEIELGFEAGFLDDRVRLEVTRYDQTTEDALYAVRYPPSAGFLSTQLENVGEIKNSGWEVGFRGTVLDRPGFSWDGTVNFSTNENEIVSLGEGGTPIQLQWLQWMREGYPIGAFFGDRYIEHNGTVGLASDLLQDGNGDLPEGWDYLGQPLPTRTIQLGSNFSLGNRWGFSFLFDHKGGHMNHDHSQRWLMQPNRDITTDQPDIGVTAGPVSTRCRNAAAGSIVEAQCARNNALTHGDYAYAADFWKLREMVLTFRAPDSWFSRIGAESTTLSLAGRNIWRSTDYPGLDPEGMYRNDLSDSALRAHNFFDTPIPRQFVFSVSASF